jgi:DNA-binding PucR family transcriptional regulator
MVRDWEAIGDAMSMHLHERIPELAADHDPALLAETRASCGANVGQILRALAHGEPVEILVTPPEAAEYARGFVRRDLPISVLLRAYRLGQGFFWDRWTATLSERTPAGSEQSEAIAASSRWIFDYIDQICSDLVDVYATAREHWARTPAAVRAETARRLLSGELRDPREASRLLGYELQRRHHTGLVLWTSLKNGGGELAALERAAAEAAEALGASDSLVVLSGASHVWAWCSGLTDPALDPETVLQALAPADGLRISVGRVGKDLVGFRDSHLEAAAAARIAVLASRRAKPVTFYDEVEVVSLLSQDLERARAFIRRELGDLGGAEPSTARLRETMLVLLEEGMSNSRAARRLFVHNNTVVYRAARAQELLGHRLTERRIQITTALMLAQTLGESVLGPESQ